MTHSIPATIPLYKHTSLLAYALIDAEDFERLSVANWTLSSTGYAITTQPALFDGEIYMHRIVARPENGDVVDHINGIRHDNRKENLRGCSHAENMLNKRRIRNSSGIRGAFLDKRDGKWSAEISVKGKSYALGRFDEAIDAGKAYDSAARQLHGAFGVLNFPELPDAYPDVDWVAYTANRLENAKNRKLDIQKAREIREKFDGENVNNLATEYQVSPAGIYNVIQKRSYKEAPEPDMLEVAFERITAGEALYRVAADLGIGVHQLKQAALKKWGATPPDTIYKKRNDAKLSREDIQTILSRVQGGETQKSLAKEYGVSIACVNGYVRGKRRI